MKIHKKKRWIKVSFYSTPLKVNEFGDYEVDHSYHHHHDYMVLKEFDLPDWVYFKHQRHLDIIGSKLQVELPRINVSHKIHAYYRAGDKTGDYYASQRIASLKGQVTKVENAIAAYEKDMKMRLIWEPENDSQYQRALAKRAEKKKNLKKAIEELKTTKQ